MLGLQQITKRGAPCAVTLPAIALPFLQTLPYLTCKHCITLPAIALPYLQTLPYLTCKHYLTLPANIALPYLQLHYLTLPAKRGAPCAVTLPAIAADDIENGILRCNRPAASNLFVLVGLPGLASGQFKKSDVRSQKVRWGWVTFDTRSVTVQGSCAFNVDKKVEAGKGCNVPQAMTKHQ